MTTQRYDEVVEEERRRKRLAGAALCWLCWPTLSPLVFGAGGVRRCPRCDGDDAPA